MMINPTSVREKDDSYVEGGN